MLFLSYVRLACLKNFHNWHKSKMAAIVTENNINWVIAFLFDIKTLLKLLNIFYRR